MISSALSKNIKRPSRAGFTLVELLVVISIMALLLTMTVLAVNFSRDAERVVGAALQVQSFLSGARDRAIQAKEPRGVRFFLDTNNHRAVTAMAYIDPAEYWSDGTIRLERLDENNDGITDVGPGGDYRYDIEQDGVFDNDGRLTEDTRQVRIVAGADPGWWELKRRGLLFDGLRIRIPKGPTGTWYTVNTRLIDISVVKTPVQKLILEIPYADPGDMPVEKPVAFANGPVDYELELPPRILPMDPVKLPVDTIIDLDGSKLPPSWRPNFSATSGGSGNVEYSQFMDVVFSPRGNVIGNAAASGIVHFYICDSNDSVTLKEEFTKSLVASAIPSGLSATMKFSANGQDLPMGQVLTFNQGIRSTPFIPTNEIRTSAAAWLPDHPDDDPYLVRDRRVVTVFTQTGGVSSHPVNVIDGDYDGIELDPFLFAETGRTGR